MGEAVAPLCHYTGDRARVGLTDYRTGQAGGAISYLSSLD
jgi:hypothetical protein